MLRNFAAPARFNLIATSRPFDDAHAAAAPSYEATLAA